MAEACLEAATDKRLVFFNNTAGTGVNADVRAILDRGGIPYLFGMGTALAAIAPLIDTATPAPPHIEVPAAPPLRQSVFTAGRRQRSSQPLEAARQLGRCWVPALDEDR